MNRKEKAAGSQEALLLKIAASLDNLADVLEQEGVREQELLYKQAGTAAQQFD